MTFFDNINKKVINEEFYRISDINYFNNALDSIPPKCVENAYKEEMNRFINEVGSENNWIQERDKAKEGIAKLIKCDTSDIALLCNTVEGIGLLVNEYPWDNKKEIVLFTGEHMTNKIPWIVGEHKGKFIIHPVECKESLSTDDILEAITDNTQAVALSLVQYSDGSMVDIKRIGQECKKRGIMVIIDGIQAVGRMVVDVKEMGIDYMSCGAHKGLLVRNGISFVYCRREILDKLNPVNASCLSVESFNHTIGNNLYDEIKWFNDARKLENGNRNHQGVCALIASTNLINTIGIENIQERIVFLNKLLIDGLGDKSAKLLPNRGNPSGIVRIDFPSTKIDVVKKILEDNSVYATVREDNVRFCISFYNTESQISILTNVILEIIKLGEN